MPVSQTALSPILATLMVVVGILVSLVLPIAVNALKKASGLEAMEGVEAAPLSFGQRLAAAWRQYGGNKYLGILLAAILVAVVIVFLLGMQFYTHRDAGLAGFAWESFIKKLFAKPAQG